jgi:hypothetical protein
MGRGARVVMVRGMATLLVFAGVTAGATSIVRQDVPELSRRADAVLRGTVVRTESRWSGDRRRIFTEVEIRVAETIKGSPGKTVVVRQPGGVVGKVAQRVDGVASFRQGEEVVVFLARKPDDSFVIQGMGQGKFRVERSSDGRDAFAIREDVDAHLVEPPGQDAAGLARGPRTLDELRAEIRSALAAQPTPPTPPLPVTK